MTHSTRHVSVVIISVIVIVTPVAFMDPEISAKICFCHFGSGSIEGVEESLASVLPQEYSQAANKMEDLLFGICNTDNMTEIDETIEKGRSILASFLSPHPFLIALFSNLLFKVFNYTKKIEYLNESIIICHQLIKSLLPQIYHFIISADLPGYLLACSNYFPDYCTQDLDESMELVSQFVSTAYGRLPERFQATCWWAFSTRCY